MGKRENIIYDCSREQLLNNLAQLRMLQDEGISIGSLEKETWERIVELIEDRDCKKLEEVRKQLREQKPKTGKV